MKHFPSLILSMLLLASCETEVGPLTEYEAPRLVVNALLTAHDEAQPLRIRMTGLTQAQRVDGATVTLRRNGADIYRHVTMAEDSLLVSTLGFEAGDVVTVDVQRDALHATASAVVPRPLLITGIDTTTVMARRFTHSDTMEPHRRLSVHLQLPQGLDTSATYYYRVEVYKDVIEPSAISVDGDIVTEVYYREPSDDHSQFSYAGDAALCESQGVDQENLSVSFDWLQGIDNLYHVFRSTYFRQGQYTLRLDFPSPHFHSSYGWAQDVRVSVYAISRSEYNYLMALSAFRSFDAETLYDTEPGVTTNVEGGAGFFGIEAVATVSFHDDHHLIQVGDNVHDF